jgi:AcrR family transcriptional regulator
MSAPAQARLNTDAVVAAAMALLDRDGASALTLARLAKNLSIRPPSLFTHVASLEDLNRRIESVAASKLEGVLRTAAVGRSGKDALRCVSHEYRLFAKAHPGTYKMLFHQERAADRIVSCLALALAPDGDGEERTASARVVLSGLHGFLSLELAGQFVDRESADRSFDRLVKTLWKSLPKQG